MILNLFRKQVFLLRMLPAQIRLGLIKRNQRTIFDALSRNFPEIYGNLKMYNIDEFLTTVWEQFNIEIEKNLLPYPTFSFLRTPGIRETMVIQDFEKILKQEITLLEKEFSCDKLQHLLEEDYVGKPHIVNSKYLTSHNSIHHLYHLSKYLDKTKTRLDDIGTVVEWGGGYGNLAKIFMRLSPKTHTYIVIDTTIFSSLQYLYLSTVIGQERVNLLQTPLDIIQPGKINLIPLCFLKKQELSADLFISTWALSESSKFSQNYVAEHEWFKSKHLLLAYQRGSADYLPDAQKVGVDASLKGALIEEIDFLPGNYYAFRQNKIHKAESKRAMASELELVEFSGVTDEGDYLEKVNLDRFEGSEYACGFFWFKKIINKEV